MMTAILGISSTALLFWSATVAGEWRSALIGVAGFALLVAAMVSAQAGKETESSEPCAISIRGEDGCAPDNARYA